MSADDDPGTGVAGSPGTSARSASGTPTVGVAATDLAERMGAAATGCWTAGAGTGFVDYQD